VTRFLFCPPPERGNTYPTVPVALELAARGHDVIHLTGPEIEPELRLAGLKSIVTAAGVYGSSGDRTAAFQADWPARLPRQVAELGEIVDRLGIEVIVDGAHPFGPRLVAEMRGLRHASIYTGAFPIPTLDPMFPWGVGAPPPTSQSGHRLAALAARVREHDEHADIAAWDAVRRALGLAPSGRHPWDHAANTDLVLVASSPALEYPRADLPERFWFIGPLLWQPEAPVPPAAAAVLEAGLPVVYVSQGTTYNSNPLILRQALAALASEPVNLIVAVGRPFDADEFAGAPANAVLEPFVPFSAVVAKIAVAVTHAGSGAVQMALSHGVPLVLLPLTGDQPELAARCVWAGAAIRLDPRDVTPEALRSAVLKVLAEPGYRAGARTVMASHARHDAPRLAADLLVRLSTEAGPLRRPLADPWLETARATTRTAERSRRRDGRGMGR
jgi:UDP:flavonoid glycosyltransferase YjiC (YdhE family)